MLDYHTAVELKRALYYTPPSSASKHIRKECKVPLRDGWGWLKVPRGAAS